MRIEHLEERRLLATVTVSNNLDIVNGDTATIVALMNDDGGDGISIREAIDATNNSPGADEINFDFGHDGPETILLTTGELRVFQALTISGGGPGVITIDAQQQSRIMRIDNFNTTVDNFEVTLAGLTLTGGREHNPANSGGAILADNLYLFINNCIVEGNFTSGSSGRGGAVFSEGYVTATNSIFRDNYTAGSNSAGGAIFARGDVTLTDCTVNNNRTTGANSFALGGAGGVRSNGSVVLLRSTVSGNWTEGDYASGGGIQAVGDITLTQSTVSGNSTLGDEAPGGGMFTFFGVDITQSTISGNSTSGSNAAGGGMRVSRQVSIAQSTITGNWTERSGFTGGGLYQTNYSNNFPVAITGTIIAGNSAGSQTADLQTDPQSTKSVDYSLIGSTNGSGITPFTGIGNLLNVNSALGPLTENGGPTKTHALLPGSPAIDAGDPNFSALSDFDQRGMPFTRVFDGDGMGGERIDIGAYELQPIPFPPAAFGDFDQDGVIGAADYTMWRDNLGAGVEPFAGADGDGSGMIDMVDFDVWKSHFGNSYTWIPELEPVSAGTASRAAVGFAAFAEYDTPITKPSIRRAARAPAAEISVDHYTFEHHASLLLMRRHADTDDDAEQAGVATFCSEPASQPIPRTLESLLVVVFDDWP